MSMPKLSKWNKFKWELTVFPDDKTVLNGNIFQVLNHIQNQYGNAVVEVRNVNPDDGFMDFSIKSKSGECFADLEPMFIDE